MKTIIEQLEEVKHQLNEVKKEIFTNVEALENDETLKLLCEIQSIFNQTELNKLTTIQNLIKPFKKIIKMELENVYYRYGFYAEEDIYVNEDGELKEYNYKEEYFSEFSQSYTLCEEEDINTCYIKEINTGDGLILTEYKPIGYEDLHILEEKLLPMVDEEMTTEEKKRLFEEGIEEGKENRISFEN